MVAVEEEDLMVLQDQDLDRDLAVHLDVVDLVDLEHQDRQCAVLFLEEGEAWVVVPDVPTIIHNQIRATHHRRMEIPRQPNPLLQPQQTQIMYKYQQRGPHKQPQVPTMHQQFQVRNNQVQQQTRLGHKQQRNKIPKRHNNRRSRSPIPAITKVTVMDTEVVIGDAEVDSVVAVEIVADIIRGHPWDKIATDKIVMGREVIGRGRQWEIHHRIAAEAVTIRI